MLIDRRAQYANPYNLSTAVWYHAIVGLLQFWKKGPWRPMGAFLRIIWWLILCAQPRLDLATTKDAYDQDIFQDLMEPIATMLPEQQLPPEYDAMPAVAGGPPPPPGDSGISKDWAGKIGGLAITHEQLIGLITRFHEIVLKEDGGRTQAAGTAAQTARVFC